MTSESEKAALDSKLSDYQSTADDLQRKLVDEMDAASKQVAAADLSLEEVKVQLSAVQNNAATLDKSNQVRHVSQWAPKACTRTVYCSCLFVPNPARNSVLDHPFLF